AGITVRLKPDTTETTEAGARRDGGSVRLQPDLLWLWLGLAMGGLALTRENALVFIAVILVWALSGSGQAPVPNPKSRAMRAAAFLAGLAIVLVPVAARNRYVGG